VKAQFKSMKFDKPWILFLSSWKVISIVRNQNALEIIEITEILCHFRNRLFVKGGLLLNYNLIPDCTQHQSFIEQKLSYKIYEKLAFYWASVCQINNAFCWFFLEPQQSRFFSLRHCYMSIWKKCESYCSYLLVASNYIFCQYLVPFSFSFVLTPFFNIFFTSKNYGLQCTVSNVSRNSPMVTVVSPPFSFANTWDCNGSE
jgi:hypothetical protein